MARLLYCALLYLATPLIWLRLLWRSYRQPEYRHYLGERWGFYREHANRPLLWVHAVSVGETRAAQPLIEALLIAHPDHELLLTGMTPTGREAGHQLYAGRVRQAYLPYDFPGATRRFLCHFRPRLGILMETEIWPNLLSQAAAQGIPMALANARLSERSARGYRRFAALAGPAFASLAAVAAQTNEDARRLQELGATQVEICGNLKFDVTPPTEKLALGRSWRESQGSRPIWLAASTREGEEVLLLDALAHRSLPGGTLVVLVPRHPQRFSEVAGLIASKGHSFRRRSEGLPDVDTLIWLGDSMGEMAAYYAMADLAYVGGSLLPLGGQNLIEAAACGCPVLVGPHTFNFAQATSDAITAGAARRVAGADELLSVSSRLLTQAEELAGMAVAAQHFAAAHRGATQRTLRLIACLLDRAAR